MSTNRVTAKAMGLRRGVEERDVGLAILRSPLMPVFVAILSEHLGGLTRQLPALEFLKLLEDDLEDLRALGFDLPRTAAEYFSEWGRQGVLIRRPGAGRDETVELSQPAQVAIRFVASLDSQRSGVTASRLANVTELLVRLASDTDAENETRLRVLRAQKAVIDAQIRQAEAGEYKPIDDDTALERLADVLSLALAIPGDFAQVSADFESLNHSLREQIINTKGSQGDVLDKVFEGVDLIETSDAGRTFDAFYAMVLDPQQSEELSGAIDEVLGRGFATTLTPAERQFLHQFLWALQRESSQVRGVMTGFSRSLRSFVQTHSYQEHRALRDAIAGAQADALRLASQMRLTAKTGYELPATSATFSSIGTWRLYNPADMRTAEPVDVRDLGVLDLAELRRKVRLAEIDFDELQRFVADVIVRLGPSSVGTVLAEHPATQGLASVVGLLSLAASIGRRTAGVEHLSWRSLSGVDRAVTTNRYIFDAIPASWASSLEVDHE